jgi:hypothetical protein
MSPASAPSNQEATMTLRETTAQRVQPLFAGIGTMNTGQWVTFFTEDAAFATAAPAWDEQLAGVSWLSFSRLPLCFTKQGQPCSLPW